MESDRRRLSGLATMVRITLMYYVDFYSLFNNPENDWKTYLKEAADSPPGPTLLTEGACHAKNKLEVLFIDTSRNIYMLFFVLSDSNKLYSNNHL